MLAPRIYGSYSLEEADAFRILFLSVAAFCSLHAAVYAGRPMLAKMIAIVAGIVNAMLITTMARHFG